MLRTQTHLWRISLLSSLGLLSSACGGETTLDTTGGAAAGGGISGGNRAGRGGANMGGGSMAMGGQDNQLGAGGQMTIYPPPVIAEGCRNATARILTNIDTGLVECDNGVVHRPEAFTCSNTLAGRSNQIPGADCQAPRPVISDAGVADSGTGAEPGVSTVIALCQEFDTYRACNKDADCTAQPFGHCEYGDGQIENYVCVYGCESDSDCGAEQACVCGENIGSCVDAQCRKQSDCGSDSLCALWVGHNDGCSESPSGLTCHSSQDDCRVDTDCRVDGNPGLCVSGGDSRVCVSAYGVVCGRPFLVEGQARLAPVVSSADFHCPLVSEPQRNQLNFQQRAHLANAWTEIGRMEHASVAAFARFSLQLLHLGAPSQLLLDTQRAMADETEHTRLAFSLASHYAGRDIGPGPLSMCGALSEPSLASVLVLVIREGCLGETVAALEAAEALAHCEDEAVKTVLQRIAEDELRHAELAWRFVAWALSERPDLQPLAASVFEELAEPSQNPAPPGSEMNFDSLPYGVVTEQLRAEIRSAAYRDVVQPCARALLSQVNGCSISRIAFSGLAGTHHCQA